MKTMELCRNAALMLVTAFACTASADAPDSHCVGTAPLRTVTVSLAAPKDTEVSGLALVLKYPSGNVTLPGGGDTAVTTRVKDRPDKAIVAAHQHDDTVRIVVARSKPIPAGRLLTVDFDSCKGAVPVAATDFSCTIEGCANQFGTIDGCGCSVAAQ
ncbi:MAG TPA: hypothetical protein VL403_19580 [Candidatus Kryptonia bacterium]|nr:hypothetical protein [Candidatus Kryptonia bacterium]